MGPPPSSFALRHHHFCYRSLLLLILFVFRFQLHRNKKHFASRFFFLSSFQFHPIFLISADSRGRRPRSGKQHSLRISKFSCSFPVKVSPLMDSLLPLPVAVSDSSTRILFFELSRCVTVRALSKISIGKLIAWNAEMMPTVTGC